ncbi:hypothetical protein ILYODFUR_023316 [Ilyodon furcidens]|uniref:Uncharacterized protein n=1 Tax=Ilyodon furcidens TaxID=33524 RepID=A0ABV0TAF4_9TELE
MATTFDWDSVIGLVPGDLCNLSQDRMDDILDMFTFTEEWAVENKSPEEIIQVFKVYQALLKKKDHELCETHNLLEEADKGQIKTELELQAKVEMLEQQLQVSEAERKTQHSDIDVDKLIEQLEKTQVELIKSREKLNQKKNEGRQLTEELQEADNEIALLKEKIIKYEETISDKEEDVKKLKREIKILKLSNLDLEDCLRSYTYKRDAKSGIMLKEKKKELEKCLDELSETQSKNEVLQNDKVLLTNLLQQSEREREKITGKYDYLKSQTLETDKTLDQLMAEKNAAEVKFIKLKQDIHSVTDKCDKIANEASDRVEECRRVLIEKDRIIFVQQKMISELKQDLHIAKIDFNVSHVGVLQEAIEDRNKTIDLLSEKLKHYTKHIEKNLTAFEKVGTRLKYGEAIRLLESKLEASEQRANSAEQALDQTKAMFEEKIKELLNVLGALRNYKSGTYGLSLAFGEFKKLKDKIKVKDCDMEVLTSVIDHLEMRVNDLMEENEDLNKKQREETNKLSSARCCSQLKHKEEHKKTQQPKIACFGARQTTNYLEKERQDPAESQSTLDKNVRRGYAKDSFTLTSTDKDEEPRSKNDFTVKLKVNENQFLQNEMSTLSREMEIVNKKLHSFGQIWKNFNSVEWQNAVSRTDMSSGSTGNSSATKRATTLDMEEFNERQRPDCGQKECKIIRASLRSLEECNAELESKVKELTKMHLNDKKVEIQLRNELANRPQRWVSDTNSGGIAKLEESERELRMRVSELQRKCSKLSEKILNLQQDTIKAQEEKRRAEEERVRAEEKAEELKIKITELEKVMSKLKDSQEVCLQEIDIGMEIDEKVKKQKDPLRKAEPIFSHDRVTNELLSISRQQLQADHATTKELAMPQSLLDLAKETIKDLQVQLEKKHDIIKKYTEKLDQNSKERKELKIKLAEFQHKVTLQIQSDHLYINQIEQMKQKIEDLNNELKVQMVLRAESLTDIAELKDKLTQKEKEYKTANEALLELREILEVSAQQHNRDNSTQTEEILIIQKQAEREIKELKTQVKNLNEKLESAKDFVNEYRKSENILKKKVDKLTQEIQNLHSTQKSIEAEREENQQEIHQLTLHLRKLTSASQKQLQQRKNESTIHDLQGKIRRLEDEFEYKLKSRTENNKEVIQFEMKKKWQNKVQNLQKSLNEKVEENESLLKKQSTLRNLLTKLEKDKRVLQDKLMAQSLLKRKKVSVGKEPAHIPSQSK